MLLLRLLVINRLLHGIVCLLLLLLLRGITAIAVKKIPVATCRLSLYRPLIMSLSYCVLLWLGRRLQLVLRLRLMLGLHMLLLPCSSRLHIIEQALDSLDLNSDSWICLVTQLVKQALDGL